MWILDDILRSGKWPLLQTTCLLDDRPDGWGYFWFGYKLETFHYCDVIMGAMASQITSLTVVYSTVYSGTDQRKYQSSPSLAFVRGIHRWPTNSPYKGPVTRKMFPFDDAIMLRLVHVYTFCVMLNAFCCQETTFWFKSMIQARFWI